MVSAAEGRPARSSRLSLGSSLPAGVLPVGFGVVASGLSAYVFLAIAARALGPVRYAPLAVLWSVTFLAGPGCFGPFEYEVGRLLAKGRATRETGTPVVRRAVLLGLGLATIVAAVTVALSPVAVPRLFDGQWWLMAAFLLSLPASFSLHLTWGILAGSSRFWAYGVAQGAEGVIRLLLGGGVLLAGVASATGFGLALAIAPAGAALLCVGAVRRAGWGGPRITIGSMSRDVSRLLAATFLSAILINAGPVVVKVLATPAQGSTASRFLAASALTRVPLFLFNAVSATLVPGLSTLAASGRSHDFRRLVVRLLWLVGVVGGAGVIGAATLGPLVLGLVFGSGYRLGRLDVALLAGSSVGLMVATTLGAAIVALGRHDRLVRCWGAGILAMALVTATMPGLTLRVGLGLVVGAVVTSLAMGAVVRSELPHTGTRTGA